uniref:Blue (Type1) copper domain-containing protein n=1 Tax=uncultured marine thaumarchaeote KM3_28_B05 TaxID=1456111 RepID=A0A075GWT1_9ARCH|nr:hypothetical protein [uncultured marine thaumarchaeote KM3_28_B05]
MDVINWVMNLDFKLKIMKMAVVFFVFTCVMGLMFTSASAQEVSIPAWVKNNAGWWANDQIPDSTFIDGIEFLIEKEIIVIPDKPEASSEKAVSIPAWVKNNAGWWASNFISDKEFLNGIQHLIKVGIIIVEQTKNSWHILDEINFVTSPSDIKLFDTTIIAEASFSKQVKIRYIESVEKGQDDQEFVQIWIRIHTVTNDIVEFAFLKSSETIVDEYDGKKLMLVEGLTKSDGKIKTNYLFVEEEGDNRMIKYMESDGSELFRKIVQPKDFLLIDGILSIQKADFNLRDGLEETYEQISFHDEINKPVVVIPTFTASAYGYNAFYTFYAGNCDETCLTTNITNEINDFSFTSSINAIIILDLLGYDSITDRQLHNNPSALDEYDSVVVLHNEYVSRTMFNAITSHENVIFLYPNALYAQVDVDTTNNLITLVRGHNYPENHIINGFDWKNENTHPYEYDTECENWEFYPTKGTPNGYMLNCYPEHIIWKDELFLKTLKDLVS